MSVASQASMFYLGKQTAKVGSGVYTPPTNFYKTRATNIGFGSKNQEEPFPFLVGGDITPPGAVRNMTFAAGEIGLILTNGSFLMNALEGVFGACTTTPNKVWDNTTNAVAVGATTGAYVHEFEFDPAGQHITPWYATRLKVPGNVSAEVYGEETYDVRFAGARFDVPAAGLLQGNFSMLGRVTQFPDDTAVNAWTSANSYEDSLTAAHAGTGFFKIAGVSYPITQLSIEVGNMTTTPQQEAIVGSYHMDDIALLSRQVTLRMMYKWENPDLYRAINTGTAAGTVWTEIPFIKDTAGADLAIDATFFSQGYMGASAPLNAVRNMFKFIGNRAHIQIDPNGITLAPQNIIMVPFTATLLAPTSGDYAKVVLQNIISAI